MRYIFAGILVLMGVLSQSDHANYVDKLVAKAAFKSAIHVVTHYPIIISSFALVIFRHEIFKLLRTNASDLMGKYPIVSYIIGLAALKIAIDMVGPSPS